MKLRHDEGWTIPPDAPFYRPLPAAYRNVRMQFVYFYADPRAVDEYLPEPLEPDGDGMCVAGGIDIPDSHYGAFQESLLLLKARFRGETGFYCSHVFHNGPAGIAAGREVYGTPKVYSDVHLTIADALVVTDTRLEGRPVLTIQSATSEEFDGDMPSLAPAWRLKIIPRADGPRPAIKQLIDCTDVTQDFVLRERHQGSGTIWLGDSGDLDLRPLAPVRYGKAICQVCDYKEGFGRIAYDYLAGA